MIQELAASGIKRLIVWECTVKQMMKGEDTTERIIKDIEDFLVSDVLQKEL